MNKTERKKTEQEIRKIEKELRQAIASGASQEELISLRAQLRALVQATIEGIDFSDRPAPVKFYGTFHNRRV